MRNPWCQALSLCAFLVLGWSAHAQLDTSGLLLHSSGSQGPDADDLDSSRYKVRSTKTRKAEPAAEDEEVPGTYIPSPVPKPAPKVEAKSVVTEPPAAQKVESVAPVQPVTPEEKKPEVKKPEVTETPELKDERPPVTVQVREMILGGDDDIEEAKKQIDPEDPRKNIVSISFAPAYFYDGSSSNYSFRDYHSDGPGFGLGMNVWLTPFFGLQSKFFSSVSGAVRDGSNMVSADTQEFEAGFRFRRHFGYSRRSAQLAWGIDYHDFSNRISPDAAESVGQHTSGLSLTLEGVIPKNNTYAHLFEVSIRPYQHSSEDATSASATSGTGVETNAVSLSLGGQWTLDRHDQVFWKAQYSVQRDLYSGSASQVDPHTGLTPLGVSVTNSLSVFYFGFKWGS